MRNTALQNEDCLKLGYMKASDTKLDRLHPTRAFLVSELMLPELEQDRWQTPRGDCRFASPHCISSDRDRSVRQDDSVVVLILQGRLLHRRCKAPSYASRGAGAD